MSYTKLTDFAAKDALLSGNPSKLLRGTELGAEFDAIQVADALNIKPDTVTAATGKTTPVDADLLTLFDSASTFSLKKLTWANLKATIKTYFDTLYVVPAGVSPRATRIDVASVAGTVDLTTNAPNTDDIRITGALAITGFTVASDRVLRVTAGGAFTLTNNANIVTQTGTNIVAVSGDTFQLRATAANTVEVMSYTPAAGSVSLAGNQTIAGTKTFSAQPVVPAQSYVAVDTFNLYGSTNTRICRFTNLRTSQGSDITYADSAANGASFTINTSGTYAVAWNQNAGAASDFGLSLNSTQLTTNINAITAANRIAMASTSGANVTTQVAITRPFTAGDVIRPHSDATGLSANPERANFTITRIA